MRRLRPIDRLLPDFLGRLEAAAVAALTTLCQTVAERHAVLYLVGGSVRDLLLNQAHLDLDFVVESDAPTIARAYSRKTAAHVTVHDQFRTATVTGTDLSFDLVTARREIYTVPGALPVITPSHLADDLARRDFTINALALAVSGPERGRLFDRHGGATDLAAGLLRALHPDSFRDDPTRLWRAGRYAGRFQLALEQETERLARRDVPLLTAISPARIGHELARILAERDPERALQFLDQLGVLDATLPGLHCDARIAGAIRRAVRLALQEQAAAIVATLVADWDGHRIEAAADRLDLPRRQRVAAAAMPAAAETLRLLVTRRATAGAIAIELERFPVATLAGYAGRYPHSRAGRALSRYLSSDRAVRTILSGSDLIDLGVAAGPTVGALLRSLRAARIDGELQTLDDERQFVEDEINRAKAVD